MRHEDTPQVIQKKESPDQQDPNEVLQEWSIEEEEMSHGIINYPHGDFATGVTFDELALAG